LQRLLWPEYRRLLRPGGLLILQTMTQDIRQIKADIDPRYLLYPGELLQAFQDWEILHYWEGWETSDNDHSRATANLIARLPELAR
jgi:tellurite methyltransferase